MHCRNAKWQFYIPGNENQLCGWVVSTPDYRPLGHRFESGWRLHCTKPFIITLMIILIYLKHCGKGHLTTVVKDIKQPSHMFACWTYINTLDYNFIFLGQVGVTGIIGFKLQNLARRKILMGKKWNFSGDRRPLKVYSLPVPVNKGQVWVNLDWGISHNKMNYYIPIYHSVYNLSKILV